MHTHEGSSLIEILISLLILSILLLGVDAMQITSLRETRASYYFSVATQQLQIMSERLHSLKARDINEQLTQWNKQNNEVLPQGHGVISGDYPHFTLTIFWGNADTNECNKNKIGQSGCLSEHTYAG